MFDLITFFLFCFERLLAHGQIEINHCLGFYEYSVTPSVLVEWYLIIYFVVYKEVMGGLKRISANNLINS